MTAAVRLITSWFAAWCQVLVVAAMPVAPVGLAASPGELPICHAGPGGKTDPHGPALPRHDGHECALCCAFCAAQGWSHAVIPQVPALPGRQMLVERLTGSAWARAPPRPLVLAAQARGPPLLS